MDGWPGGIEYKGLDGEEEKMDRSGKRCFIKRWRKT